MLRLNTVALTTLSHEYPRQPKVKDEQKGKRLNSSLDRKKVKIKKEIARQKTIMIKLNEMHLHLAARNEHALAAGKKTRVVLVFMLFSALFSEWQIIRCWSLARLNTTHEWSGHMYASARRGEIRSMIFGRARDRFLIEDFSKDCPRTRYGASPARNDCDTDVLLPNSGLICHLFFDFGKPTIDHCCVPRFSKGRRMSPSLSYRYHSFPLSSELRKHW